MARVLPRLDSLIENEFREEQKSSKDEVKGGYSSEKEGAGAYLAPMGKAPKRDAEKGMLGATLAVGRGPLTKADGWRGNKTGLKSMKLSSKRAKLLLISAYKNELLHWVILLHNKVEISIKTQWQNPSYRADFFSSLLFKKDGDVMSNIAVIQIRRSWFIFKTSLGFPT